MNRPRIGVIESTEVESLSMPLIDRPSGLPGITFFADASSKGHHFMVAGGFAIANTRIAEVVATITEMQKTHGITEFHWSEYKGGASRTAYEALVRYAFKLVRARQAALHILISEFRGYKHSAKPGENRDTSVNKMYYQLLLHRAARFYGKTHQIHVRLDAGNDSKDICRMRNQLCKDAYASLGSLPNCVRSLQAMPSHLSPLIQMADVILGGVAAKCNMVTHRSAKGPLADLILSASNRKHWQTDTSPDARFLTVWNFRSGKTAVTPRS